MTVRAPGADARARTAVHAYLCLTFTSICFGANTTFAKLVVGEVSPMMVVALRWLLVVALLLAFNWKALVRDWPNLKPHLGFLFLMGALGFAAFNGLFYIAAHHTTAVNMGIIQAVLPVFVLVGALLVYRAPARGLQWVGAGVTLAGVAVVVSAGDMERLVRLRFNAGDLLVVLAALLYAGYTVGLLRRPASTALGLFTVLAASAFLASVPMVAVEAWLGEFQAPTLRGWAVGRAGGAVPVVPRPDPVHPGRGDHRAGPRGHLPQSRAGLRGGDRGGVPGRAVPRLSWTCPRAGARGHLARRTGRGNRAGA